MDLESIRQKRLQEIIDELNSACSDHQILPEDGYLTEISVAELRAELIRRKRSDLNSSPLINVIFQFHERQRQSQNEYFALTDVLTRKALDKAKALEANFAPEDLDKCPLYGFVLSMKESIRMKGYSSSCGLARNVKKYENETRFIDYIESQGGVIISRGNLPQMLFAIESWNNLYGSVSNPWNKERTAGGSSGGDCALVALKHVNGAFGTDYAGSLRIPAMFCGVCALNMTPQRTDLSAYAPLFENMEDFASFPDPQFVIRGSIGPIARNVDDLSLLARVFINNYTVNSRLAPVPWRDSLPPLTRVGLLVEWNNLFDLTEANRRAIKMAKESLLKAGIQVIDIDIRSYVRDLVRVIGSIYYKSGPLVGAMNGQIPINEPLLPVYERIQKAMTLPSFVRLLFRMFNRDQLVQIFADAYHYSLIKNQTYLANELKDFRNKLISQMENVGVKTLVCPGMMPALIKGTSSKTNIWSMYTFVWNGFGFPAGALPVTRVREDEQFYNSKLNYEFHKGIKETMKGSKGLPVGVQVVGLPWHEEHIFQVMKVIEKDVAFQ